MNTGKIILRWADQLVTQTDVPSLVWTWLRANGHIIMYETTHNTATPLHHTVTQVQHWPGKGDDSSEHLLAEQGQLSLSTLTQRKSWRFKPSQQDKSMMFAAGSEHPTFTATVRMNIWGVTQPGMGKWSPEVQYFSRLGHLTNWVIERNNIKFNL